MQPRSLINKTSLTFATAFVGIVAVVLIATVVFGARRDTEEKIADTEMCETGEIC